MLVFHPKFLKLYGIHYFENIMDTEKFCSTRSREKGRLYSQFIESFILYLPVLVLASIVLPRNGVLRQFTTKKSQCFDIAKFDIVSATVQAILVWQIAWIFMKKKTETEKERKINQRLLTHRKSSLSRINDKTLYRQWELIA